MTSTPYTVADVMTHQVVAVTPTAEFKEIVSAIERWKVTALPVIEGEGRVVGIVSEADLLPKEEFHAHRPGMIEQMRRLGDTSKAGSTCAEDLMTTPAVTVRPGTTLPQAARLMAERRIKRLPVVDADGILKGIVSRADLLKVFLRSDDELAAEIRHEVVEQLFPVSRGTVKVDVTHGVVTLSGGVRDARRIPMATRLAQAVEGVVGVHNRLEALASAPDEGA
ncbi:CBS domain-containing protein [Streptomyces sp. NPDC056224]|uniref:CBS domain-containing protein n=1 Tax=Streptomyces sp. NPDC056224 TaxID=3345750 RepID=UPI0035D8B990